MGCVTSLNLNSSLGDNGMDNAVFASGASAIIGIRGNRVFRCDPTSGAVLQQADLGNFGRNGCVSYDSGTNKVFCAAWDSPGFTARNATFTISNRNIYRINPATLAVEITADIGTQFSIAAGNAMNEYGISAMDSGAGNIYCRWFQTGVGGVNRGNVGGTLRFSAANMATQVNENEGVIGGYANVIYANVTSTGHDNALFPDQAGGPQAILSDYVSNTEVLISAAFPQNMLAVGFAPTQQHVFLSDIAQKIYIYSIAGALLATADTLQSAFNGLKIRYNSNDGKIYVAGGNSNFVAQIDPTNATPTIANGGIVMYSGFDCPVDLVFTGSVRFAVQAGSTPLKSF